jgi:hypothetical protein
MTRSGVPVSPAREAWAREQIKLLGIERHPFHDIYLDAARRGFPAWRIAQNMQCEPGLVERLGGQPA